MDSGKQESFINKTQQLILLLVLISILTLILVFRNLFYQPTVLLKSFSQLSINPEIAFTNNKPTFLEFYAEWCDVCREMSTQVADLKQEYQTNINFVFLNVDNPKWEYYLKKFKVNGIPQVNLLDKKGHTVNTFIGKQEENSLKESLEDLENGISINKEILTSDLSSIRKKKNFQVSPRSHG